MLVEAEYLAIVVSGILYMLLLLGLISLNFTSLCICYHRIRMQRRLAARKKEYEETVPGEDRLSQALWMALGRPLPAKIFLTGIGGLFLTAFLASIRTLHFFGALLTALTAAAIPCLMLFVRLSGVRKKGSGEGEALISEFLRQYRISGGNIFETIEKVLAVKAELRVTGKLLFRLLLELRNTGNSQKIGRATEELASALNTNWGRMLARSIHLAADKGVDISLALEDILIQLRGARAAAEERKRMNSEAVRMAFFLVPFTYIATSVLAVFYLDITPAAFLANQFLTPEGLSFFVYILFFFMGNLALISLVSSQRFDF